jgi:putative glycosyltransferase (TIGR04348 family)
LKIRLITPAVRQSRAGNRATATRWARFLRQLGHRVEVTVDYGGEPADLMLALHAWRSADAIRQFHALYPERPLVVALTGTDIYKFQFSDPAETLASMALADTLIALHDRVWDDIPDAYGQKLRVVLQSAVPAPQRLDPVRGHFDVCVVGHLREEKDSLRAAYAVRDLPEHSRLRVVQVGKAHSAEWDAAAHAEMASNPRYRWRGEVTPGRVRHLMARARLMVMSSVMEGGANVVSEACVAGLPVIASAIPGNVGLLGDNYPGYYPARDTAALQALLLRAETEPAFVDRLRRHCLTRARLFTPEAEKNALKAIVEPFS